MIEAGLFKAAPLDLSDPAKLSYLLDRLVEHESHWTDFQKDPNQRRLLASSLLADAIRGEDTFVFEVWRVGETSELVGILSFTSVRPGMGAQFHPVFFDGKLRNAFGKRELLLRAMDWAFNALSLHRLSVELPETMYALVTFSRKKLGFRFEAENRTIRQQRLIQTGPSGTYGKAVRRLVALTPGAREAEYGSRRFQAVLKDGKWLDMLLLSVTREEFNTFVREATCQDSSTDPTPSSPSPAT